MTTDTLVFVYNADGGAINAAIDIAHKLFSPKTYQCRLCAVTHGTFKMRDAWKGFIDELNHPMDFLHRDEFLEAYPAYSSTELPAILMRSDEAPLSMFISSEEINQCEDVEQLKRLIKHKLPE